MFTGIIEGRGQAHSVTAEGVGIRLVIEVPPSMLADECRLGDSVAINGCCLTVVDINANHWSFQAGTETLSKTNLGRLQPGDFMNLERSLRASGRLDGHIVQGHVDGVGTVDAVDREGDWVTMWFRVPEPLAERMVPKGSVAVDGVSLTVVNVERDRFSVALIPHTLEITTLGLRQPGEVVNIENDILGKYVARLLRRE